MTTKQDPYIAKVAKAFGYDYDYAAKRIGRAANIRHLRPSTLAKEILDKLGPLSPRQMANEAVRWGHCPSAIEDEAHYDAAKSVARNIRTAYRLGIDYAEAKDKNQRKEQSHD